MSREYKRKELAFEKEAALSREEQMEPKTKNGIITGAPNINIRSEPSKMSEALATVPEGTHVEILGESGEFKYVRYVVSEKFPEIWGYVHSRFCKEVDS